MDGKPVLKFSKKFNEVIASRKSEGYILTGAKVNFILLWQKEGVDREVKIILPEIWFERESNTSGEPAASTHPTPG